MQNKRSSVIHKTVRRVKSIFGFRTRYLQLESRNELLEKKVNELSKGLNRLRYRHERQTSKAHERIGVLTDLLGELMYPDNVNKQFDTAQDKVWSTHHGFRYVTHHLGEDWKLTRIPYWEVILDNVPECHSILEFGCNIGSNLKAINLINPNYDLSGIEINPFAVDQVRKLPFVKAEEGSIVNHDMGDKYDFVFSRGVLIHINREDLPVVFDNMVKHSRKYIMLFENYNDEDEALDGYGKLVTGGESGESYQFWANYPKLFKSQHPDWELISSGVRTEKGRTPVKGDLYWAIFKAPEEQPSE
ncbi:class I SAM-dependent methyltransferase [Enterovibrio norvegicus]|uniref:methyltransferase n=1 Tax=Enterovibrio norvegicus TaxID=188144 RepID=UPI003D0A7D7E